ncbi:MAG: flavodoxin domain-containing protein [Thermoplasmatota archaeon]
MKGIILFQSKHGSTRQYAEWIAEETGFPLIDLKQNVKPDLKDADILIIGSWVRAGKMISHGWIKKNWSSIQDKEVIVFAVGGDVPDEQIRKKVLDGSLPEGIKENISFYLLHGRFRQEDQNIFLRKMLNFAAKYDKEDELAQNMVKGVDGVKRDNLHDLFEKIRSLSK